ncbi:uncharacterized protein LOC135824480 [Sycon ciliatum]|uniref:uncharacterized protein LOC135824480 n=1 Tax=Sycon ciliatum TaxID=27933 RepID=UPI0020AE5508|eukprot:scpid82765/ scgid32144/ 
MAAIFNSRLYLVVVVVMVIALQCTYARNHDAMGHDPVPNYCQYTINLAAKGYDVVAYFSLDAKSNGTIGSSEHSFVFNNATFHFSSVQNMVMFKSNPWKYHPAFGGFCAFGMAKFPSTLKELQQHPPIGPPICPLTQWTVFNGTLYLNDCATRDQWLANRDTFIKDAVDRWQSYFGMQHGGPTNIDCFGP